MDIYINEGKIDFSPPLPLTRQNFFKKLLAGNYTDGGHSVIGMIVDGADSLQSIIPGQSGESLPENRKVIRLTSTNSRTIARRLCDILTGSIWMIFFILFLAAGALADAGELYFPHTPAVSPDGEKVAFSYDEDLWIVDTSGGTALRLTAMAGQELYPRFSPDGKWLAFSGSCVGNLDVYVMPVSGGDIRQLTFHSSNDRVDSWSWDSKYIYFNSDRYNDFTEYKVSADGGTPRRLFENYFNTPHGVVEHPLTGSLYFTDTWESFRFANRKKYKGAYNPDIKSYNIKTKEYTVHTTYRGKDFSPTIDKDGNIYFISDRENDEYNLFTIQSGRVKRLTDFPTSISNSSVSAGGGVIVFEKNYRLYTYRVKAGITRDIPIRLFKYDTLALHQDFNVKGNITHFDISPDTKKIAFISRGELFVSDIKGKFIKRLTGGEGRVMEVKWLADNKTLLFNSTINGWLNLFTIPAFNRQAAQQLTFDKANNRHISLNNERSSALYLSGRKDLKLLDLKTLKSEKIVEDEFWGLYNSQPCFSPDDRFVVFAAYRNFERDILVYDLKSGITVNLTNSGTSEIDPFWSPDGKYLFFAADRFDPDYPRGGNKNKIYRLPLQKYDGKFRAREFDKLFRVEEAEKGKKKGKAAAAADSKKPPVRFDYEDMIKRWEQVSPNGGGQYHPMVTAKEDEYTVLYMSDHDGEKLNLWKTTIKPFDPNKTEKIKGAQTDELVISGSGDAYYILLAGAINELDLAKNSVTPIDMDFTFRRSLGREFSQMFYEVWANLSENYYDETFHGVDWVKIREHYEQFLPHIRSRSDLRRLINDMLGELNSSHLGFNSGGEEEKTFYQTRSMHSGIVFEEDFPYRVKHIVSGSATDKIDIDIKPGDILTAVNDQEVVSSRNREFYFTAPSADKEMKLSFSRNKRPFDVYIHPEDNRTFKNDLYDEWIGQNRKYVDEKSNNRIAYVYMKNMGLFELRNFIIEMTGPALKKEALILDLRYNTGGNVHDAVLDFLSQKPYTQWQYRGGKFAPQPNFAPAAKPIVLLVNEQSLSDAEMTAAGFKALHLGTIIGTETYRWLIFTSGKSLVDGSFYRLPSWGCYTLDGKDIERHGVTPDIYVNTTFKNRLDGKDPQLDAAVKKILSQLDKK